VVQQGVKSVEWGRRLAEKSIDWLHFSWFDEIGWRNKNALTHVLGLVQEIVCG